MDKPLLTNANTPLSLTLGRFDFVANTDDDTERLHEEIQALKSRIATLEAQQARTPWWKRWTDRP